MLLAFQAHKSWHLDICIAIKFIDLCFYTFIVFTMSPL